MDAKACKQKKGKWNPRKKECMLRYRVQTKNKKWGYATGYHVDAKNATEAKKKVAINHELKSTGLMARQLGWPP